LLNCNFILFCHLLYGRLDLSKETLVAELQQMNSYHMSPGAVHLLIRLISNKLDVKFNSNFFPKR